MKNNHYGMSVNLKLPFEVAVAAITDALKTEGFGILTEIDVQATLRKKLDVAFRRYLILGACNPPLAHEALQNEREIGLLMPCNVIVYEGDAGATTVSIADPQAMVAITGAPALAAMANKARIKLARALATLPEMAPA